MQSVRPFSGTGFAANRIGLMDERGGGRQRPRGRDARSPQRAVGSVLPGPDEDAEPAGGDQATRRQSHVTLNQSARNTTMPPAKRGCTARSLGISARLSRWPILLAGHRASMWWSSTTSEWRSSAAAGHRSPRWRAEPALQRDGPAPFPRRRTPTPRHSSSTGPAAAPRSAARVSRHLDRQAVRDTAAIARPPLGVLQATGALDPTQAAAIVQGRPGQPGDWPRRSRRRCWWAICWRQRCGITPGGVA